MSEKLSNSSSAAERLEQEKEQERRKNIMEAASRVYEIAAGDEEAIINRFNTPYKLTQALQEAVKKVMEPESFQKKEEEYNQVIAGMVQEAMEKERFPNSKMMYAGGVVKTELQSGESLQFRVGALNDFIEVCVEEGVLNVVHSYDDGREGQIAAANTTAGGTVMMIGRDMVDGLPNEFSGKQFEFALRPNEDGKYTASIKHVGTNPMMVTGVASAA